jgi:putative transposase
MGNGTRKWAAPPDVERVSLGELIHQCVRGAIEAAVHEELRRTLGVQPYERHKARRGYRNGTRTRTLTGPTGPLALTVPRATLFDGREWTSALLPRYQRRLPEVNEAIAATYLAGGNTRRIRGALHPLLKDAPLSKSAVSRVVATLKDGLAEWRMRSLADIDAIYLYLDGFALRVRSAGKVVSVPVLGVVGVLVDGRKQLLALDLCSGESFAAWKGCLDDLAARGLRAPVLCIVDGNAGLRRAVGLVWPRAAARTAYTAFERTWAKRCPGVVTSLREGGDELLTFFRLPKAQWKTLRTTNVIERLHEEFRRRVKTQGSLPGEDAAVVLLFSLVASGQIKLPRIDGWQKIASVLSQQAAA